MTDSTVQPIESTSIVTARQYAVELRRPPALPPLSEGDMKRARGVSRTLIRTEDQLDDIVTFGNDAQARLAQVTKDMLRGVRATTLDDVIELSDGVLGQINTLSIVDLTPAARRYLLFLRESTSAIRHRIDKFFKRYDLVNAQLDSAEANIFQKETASTRRYYADAELEQATLDVMLDARIKLAAIKLFLAGDYGNVELERRQRRVAEEKAAAASENRSIDFMIVTAAERYAKYIERLEMKKATLQQLILSAYQTSITIRMMRDNENVIRQKLSDVRTEVLPQWRTLITIAYNSYLQHGIAEFVGRMEDAETRLRIGVADRLEQTAFDIADMMTRPSFDPEAMIYYHEKLVSSLEILKTASIEAKKIRESAEAFTQTYIKKLGDEL